MTSFSLIICTRNRANQLSATLNSVSAACKHYAPNQVDVIIVNNGSTDDTQRVVEAWLTRDTIAARCIYESKAGLSNARNTGVAHARGDIIAFSDDDCVLADDFFAVAQRYYHADTEPVIRGGKVTLGDPTDAPYTILLDDRHKVMTDIDSPGGFIIGANMIIPRSIFDAVGVFDPRFGAGAPFKAAEESDLILRAYRRGFRVEYLPDLCVQHFHGRKDLSDIARLSRGYYLGTGAMFIKHITDVKLLRFFYWDAKHWLKNLIKRRYYASDPVLAITYNDIMIGYTSGMLAYVKHTLGRVWARDRSE